MKSVKFFFGVVIIMLASIATSVQAVNPCAGLRNDYIYMLQLAVHHYFSGNFEAGDQALEWSYFFYETYHDVGCHPPLGAFGEF